MSEKKSSASKSGFIGRLTGIFRKSAQRSSKDLAASSRAGDPDDLPEGASTSSFTRIAQRKGYLTKDEAVSLDELEAVDLESTSSDLAVVKGYLTEEEAQDVCQTRKDETPRAHVDDLYRRASQALEATHASSQRLKDATTTGDLNVSDVLAAKKASSGG